MPGGVAVRDDPNLHIIEELASPPDGHVDYTLVQIAIERAANPTFDAKAFNATLDHWVAVVRARVPKDAPPTTVMTALGQVIYQSGPWNDHHPFSYDLDDPFGKIYQNKLVSTYLRTRKGNCVSMPTLLMILGQKLGLTMTLSQAPEHEFARLQDVNGRWFNIEGTSPASWPDSVYIHEMNITQKQIDSGIYLRTTTPHETVAGMLEPLEAVYAHQRRPGDLLGLAMLVVKLDPKNAGGYVNEANAFFLELEHRYLDRHLTPAKLPPEQRADFQALYDSNTRILKRVEAMGWVPPTAAEDKAYLERIERYKATHGG
ncbi:transglutaminase family protein [Rhodanobacter geophilus]|uniref:Transglutaminase family protein n=1 Tax=Rhodanobacter geophilus TaxID=3162488 RepID=A0ABV3QLN0_9GAMM